MRRLSTIFLAGLAIFPIIALGNTGVTPNDPLFVGQDYLSHVAVDRAWSLSEGSSKVIVAVIDNGIDFTHPDLHDSAWVNTGEIAGNGKDDDRDGYVDDVSGYNFLFGSSFMKPLGDHGTRIAGIIGAMTNNGLGISGINWKIRILPIIACSSESCDDDAVIKGIRYAADRGADVINISLAGPGWDEDLNRRYRDAIDYAYKKGSVIVIAAGNGFSATGHGKNLNILKNSPVCSDEGDEVLGVTSVNYDNQKSSFADFGSDCIDLVAPGEDILSTSIPYYNTDTSEYATGDGTSFATPIVAGISALIKSANPNLKNFEIIKILKETSTNIDAENSQFIGQLGRGLVNAESAVMKAITMKDAPSLSSAHDCISGRLVKGSFTTVYYCGADGKRYVFTGAKEYFSWYDDFSGVIKISDSNLAALQIGGIVTYRPGVKLLKITSDPKVYAVSRGGVLRPVKDEATAACLYGSDWNTQIDDVSDAFFINYRMGAEIVSCGTDYDKNSEMNGTQTINADKNL